MERVAIFIDGSNFYYGIKATLGHTKIDFGKLVNKLCGRREFLSEYYKGVELTRTYYYGCPQNEEQKEIFKTLRTIPFFDVKERERQKKLSSGEWTKEKGVDVELATDMLRLAMLDNYDVAVLISGDGDFVPVVEAVKEASRGKHVINAYCPPNKNQRYFPSKKLIEICDHRIPLNKRFLQDCCY